MTFCPKCGFPIIAHKSNIEFLVQYKHNEG